MKRFTLTGMMIIFFATLAYGQKLTQTVRGTIIDIDTKSPLIGVNILIVNSQPLMGASTDLNGSFRLNNVPIGRITLKLSYIGYETKTIPDIIVNSGKEVVLDLTMVESVIKLTEVVVAPEKNKGEALNDMAFVSVRSISASETKRYTGTWDDPTQVLQNYAGVSTSNLTNDLIIRGNSPKYVQWRLEGVDIVAPNHQTDQNSTLAGFSCLNNKLLAASDFYTSAFSPEFGNTLSGIYDVRLRPGNNEKFEAMAGVGILGTDFTVEGPLKSNSPSSYLVNYRFSNIGLIQKLGILSDIDGITTTFQDANFKVVLPTEKFGTFSFFGVGGQDNLKVVNVTPVQLIIPGNNEIIPGYSKEFNKSNYLANIGISHLFTINNNSYTKLYVTYSRMSLSDDIYESTVADNNLVDRKLNFSSRINTTTIKGIISYSNKFTPRDLLHVGSEYSVIKEENNQSNLENFTTNNRFTLVDYMGNIPTLQNYITWKHSFGDDLCIVSGFHNMNVLLNNKSTFEPRIALNWNLDNTSALNIGYGKHSTMETAHNYFTRIKQADGSIIEPNKELDLLKAEHFVVSYQKNITENIRAKIELYYQSLYNLPVENNPASYYSTINEGSDFKYVPLVNKGTGRNYGIEATVEQYFHNNFYFMVNGSVYDSKYKTLEGIERNTKFNSNYMFNFLFGKEFDKLGENENQTLTISFKLTMCGGQRYIPLLRDENGNLAVNTQTNSYWDYTKAYNDKLDNIYQLNLAASYKFNIKNVTHEIFLDLTNITNKQERLYEFYDESKPDKVNYVKPMGLLPNLMYRVYF